MWSSSFSINTTDFFLLNTPKLNTPGKHRLKPYCTLWNTAIANIKDEMSWNKTESHGKSIVSHSGRDYLEGKEIFHLVLHRYFTVYPLFTLCYTLALCHFLIFKRHNFTFNFHWRGYEHHCHVENLLFVLFCFFLSYPKQLVYNTRFLQRAMRGTHCAFWRSMNQRCARL